MPRDSTPRAGALRSTLRCPRVARARADKTLSQWPRLASSCAIVVRSSGCPPSAISRSLYRGADLSLPSSAAIVRRKDGALQGFLASLRRGRDSNPRSRSSRDNGFHDSRSQSHSRTRSQSHSRRSDASAGPYRVRQHLATDGVVGSLWTGGHMPGGRLARVRARSGATRPFESACCVIPEKP
jgi:hypothetical protein